MFSDYLKSNRYINAADELAAKEELKRRELEEAKQIFKERQSAAAPSSVGNFTVQGDPTAQQRNDFLFNGTVPNPASVGTFTAVPAPGRRTAGYFPSAGAVNTSLLLQQTRRGGELTSDQTAVFRDNMAAFPAPKIPIRQEMVMTEVGKQVLRDYYGDVADKWSDDEKQQKYLEMQWQLAGEQGYEEYQKEYAANNARISQQNAQRTAALEKKASDLGLVKLPADNVESAVKILENRLSTVRDRLFQNLLAKGIHQTKAKTMVERDPQVQELTKQLEELRIAAMPVDLDLIEGTTAEAGVPDGKGGRVPYDPKNPEHEKYLLKLADRSEADRKNRIAAFVDKYNSGIDAEVKKLSETPEFRLLPAPEATGADPESVQRIYKERMRDNPGAFKIQNIKDTENPEYQDRRARYENIQSAAAHGNVSEVYNMLTPEERKKHFSGYTPELQRRYNLYREQRESTPEFKLQKAQKAALDLKTLQMEYDTTTHAPEDIAFGLVRAGAAFSSLSEEQQKALKKYLNIPEDQAVTDKEMIDKVMATAPTDEQTQYQPLYNQRVNNLRMNSLSGGTPMASRKSGGSANGGINVFGEKPRTVTEKHVTEELDRLAKDKNSVFYGKTITDTGRQNILKLMQTTGKNGAKLTVEQAIVSLMNPEISDKHLKIFRNANMSKVQAVANRLNYPGEIKDTDLDNIARRVSVNQNFGDPSLSLDKIVEKYINEEMEKTEEGRRQKDYNRLFEIYGSQFKKMSEEDKKKVLGMWRIYSEAKTRLDKAIPDQTSKDYLEGLRQLEKIWRISDLKSPSFNQLQHLTYHYVYEELKARIAERGKYLSRMSKLVEENPALWIKFRAQIQEQSKKIQELRNRLVEIENSIKANKARYTK
jgi:hypothetical protein